MTAHTNKLFSLTLHIWRQKNAQDTGRMVTYKMDDVSPDMSFLEMLDVLNEKLTRNNEEPIAFDHDCREGICGMCSLMINGKAHGPQELTTTCQLHMRKFGNGDEIYIEPWRARAFPVVRDLVDSIANIICVVSIMLSFNFSHSTSKAFIIALVSSENGRVFLFVGRTLGVKSFFLR